MNKVQILVFGKHPQILETLLRLVNAQEDWHGTGSVQEEEIIEFFHRHDYDIVLLGGGISDISERKIRALFQQSKPEVKIIQHFGGGSGLLKSEIETALQNNNARKKLEILDNPFDTD